MTMPFFKIIETCIIAYIIASFICTFIIKAKHKSFYFSNFYYLDLYLASELLILYFIYLIYIYYFLKCLFFQIETFGILLSRLNKKLNKYEPYCLDCALKLSPLLEGFTCIKAKDIQNLINIYDNFILNELPTTNAAFTYPTLNW